MNRKERPPHPNAASKKAQKCRLDTFEGKSRVKRQAQTNHKGPNDGEDRAMQSNDDRVTEENDKNCERVQC